MLWYVRKTMAKEDRRQACQHQGWMLMLNKPERDAAAGSRRQLDVLHGVAHPVQHAHHTELVSAWSATPRHDHAVRSAYGRWMGG